MSVRLRTLAVVSALGACSTPQPAPSPSAPALATPSTSTPTAQPPPKAEVPVVVVARSGVTFEGVLVVPIEGDPAAGADAKHKRSGPNDLYLPPLAGALAKAQSGGRLETGTEAKRAELTIVVEPDVPYRLLIEVLFTAGQNSLGRHLIREGAGGTRTVVAEPPRPLRGLPDASPEPGLNLAILIVPGGIAVKTSGGNVAPGCGGVGAGLAIPRVADGQDFAGLATCVARVKAEKAEFAAEQSYTITATAGTPFRDVMSAIEAMRGKPGLGTVYFGVAK